MRQRTVGLHGLEQGLTLNLVLLHQLLLRLLHVLGYGVVALQQRVVALLLLFPQRGLLLRKQLQEQLLLEKPELLRVRGAACDCRCSGGGGAGRRRGLTHRARGGRKRQQQRTRGLAGGVTGSLAAPTSESTLPSGTTLFSLKAFVSPRCLSSRSSATSSTGFSPVAEKQGPFQLQVHSVAP